MLRLFAFIRHLFAHLQLCAAHYSWFFITHCILLYFIRASEMTKHFYSLSLFQFDDDFSTMSCCQGLRVTAICGAFGTCIGAWVKVFSVDPELFYVGFIGQSIVATSQVSWFFLIFFFNTNRMTTGTFFWHLNNGDFLSLLWFIILSHLLPAKRCRSYFAPSWLNSAPSVCIHYSHSRLLFH